MLVGTRHPPLPLCGAYEGGQPVPKRKKPPHIPSAVEDSFEAGVSSLKAQRVPNEGVNHLFPSRTEQ